MPLSYDGWKVTTLLNEVLKPMIEEGRTLTREQARAVLEEILAGPEPEQAPLAALLTTMAARGETAAELAGFAEAMRAAATPLPLSEAERGELVDTCGTGGDGAGTFNISTGAALVAAAAGARVAKHGNRAVTSRCGSADVLEALGVPINLDPNEAARCLRETGFLFLLATALHPAMRRVGPVRRALGFRTIFNLAGPLTNPAGARAQVMGVWSAEKLPVVAEAMELLGVRHALVVHGEVEGCAGLDELTVTGRSHLAEVRSGAPAPACDLAGPRAGVSVTGKPMPRRFSLDPHSLGLRRAELAVLGGGGSAEESASVLEAVLKGREQGPRREIVLLNAAAALLVAGRAADLQEGLGQAAEAIDAGQAAATLERLRAFGRAKH